MLLQDTGSLHVYSEVENTVFAFTPFSSIGLEYAITTLLLIKVKSHPIEVGFILNMYANNICVCLMNKTCYCYNFY
jgi:hypothetical protein